MTDLTQTSTAIALQLINDTNLTTFTTDQVTLSSPVLNDQILNGQNTLVTVTPKVNSAADLPVDVTYNRLSLKRILEVPYCQIPAATPSRIADILPTLNAKYFLNLTVTDIVDAPYRPTDVATGIKMVTFSCQSTSLVYTGTVTVYLGDPDLIYDWFSRPHYQFSSDFTNLTFQGNNYIVNGRDITVPAQTLSPGSSAVAAYLGIDKTIRLSNQYVSAGQLLAHFTSGIMKEVLGKGGQTSYDAQGNIKAAVPDMTGVLNNIPEDLKITAQVVNNHLVYSTGYDVANKKATSGTTYYVDGKTGVDTNDGTTTATAFKSIRRAMAAVPQARIISVAGYDDYYYDSSTGWVSSMRNVSLDIIGTGSVPARITGTQVVTDTWTNQIANVWFINLANFGAIVDLANTDTNNGYARLTSVKDIGTCQTTVSSYFYDTVAQRLYVNLYNGRQPDGNVLLVTKSLAGAVADAASVYMENLRFDLSYAGFTADMTTPRVSGYLYAKNCIFGWTATAASFNSYGFNVILQNCKASYGYNGGFLYGSDRILPSMLTKPWVVELNSTAIYCGFTGQGTSPGSAVTSYVTAVRFNGTYSYCDGNTVQDSGDYTLTLNIGCSATSSKWSSSNVAQYTAGVNSVNSAAAYYYSCSQDNLAISYYPKGVAVNYLHDTSVGYRPCYQRETPYLFVYSA